jgi:hypothetical protein
MRAARHARARRFGQPADRLRRLAVVPDAAQARAERKASAFCRGAGLDALTLAATILTVVVIDADVFDDLFGEAVRYNSEGEIIFGEQDNMTGYGIDFTEHNVRRLVEREPMAAPDSACLALAWRNRMALLPQ